MRDKQITGSSYRSIFHVSNKWLWCVGILLLSACMISNRWYRKLIIEDIMSTALYSSSLMPPHYYSWCLLVISSHCSNCWWVVRDNKPWFATWSWKQVKSCHFLTCHITSCCPLSPFYYLCQTHLLVSEAYTHFRQQGNWFVASSMIKHGPNQRAAVCW